jgi:hypothetical protein
VVDLADEHAHHLLGDGLDQIVLALEVPVDRAHGQAGLDDHVLHGGGVEPVAGEAGAGGVQDLAPAGCEVCLGDSWHGTLYKTSAHS